MKTFASIVVSLVAVALCGGAGALAGFALSRELGLSGLAAALVALVVGVVVATLLWIVGVAALRKSGCMK